MGWRPKDWESLRWEVYGADIVQAYEDGADAMAVKLVEWLDGVCADHAPFKGKKAQWMCSECRQQLRREVLGKK